MKKNILLLLVALIAFSVISWDYTSGHTIEDVVDLEYCPVCDSFKSVQFGVILLYILILIGLAPLISYCTRESFCLAPSLLHSSAIPDRAPPCSA